MFNFGFSYVGLIYLIMLFVPNIIWIKKKPLDYEKYQKNESRILAAFERIGEALVCCCALIFSDFNIRKSYWAVWLILSFVLMLLYEMYWVRYFRSERKMSDFYSGFCGFPVAGATLPVVAFFLLGIYGSNIFLIISTVILGVGHIGIHLNHRKEVMGGKKKPRLISRILKWLGAGALAFVFAIIVFVIGCRNFNYFQHYVNLQNGVDEGIYVPLAGEEQYLLIRGENKENPVIIYLHGGPSSADSYCTYGFTNYLTDDYTVIAWDQRGCGRTYFKNMNTDPDNKTVSFEQAKKDLNELVDYARTRFSQDKVIIMGHSYGTILGSQYVNEYPEKVSAYIGAAQVLSMEDTTLYCYEDALSKAKEAGDDTFGLISALEKLQAERSIVNIMNLRRATDIYHPVEVGDQSTWMAVTSPYFGMDDFRWFLKQLGSIEEYLALNKPLYDYTESFDIEGTDYSVPAYFISGSCDWVCPAVPIEEYMNNIPDIEKEFVLIDGCGHNVQYSRPEEFSNAVKSVLNRN